MIKILVFSDSHGSLKEMNAVIKANPDTAHILFAGDYRRDIYRAETTLIPVSAVCGNCDMREMFSDTDSYEKTLVIGKTKILLLHGHTLNVKASTELLYSRAFDEKADICVFGHTHIPEKKNIGGILFVNPGSISAVKSDLGPTYAELILADSGEIENVFIKRFEA